MSTTTKVLLLTGRVNTIVSPPAQNGAWTNTLASGHKRLSVPEPRLADCPSNVVTHTGLAVNNTTDKFIMFQWVSPQLDGAQNFAITDSVAIVLASHDVGGLGAGHDTRTRAHMRIVDSAGADRGASLIAGATATGTDPIPHGGPLAVQQFYNGVLESGVAAQDGDRIVVELGYIWSSNGVPFDSDNHGPDEFRAGDDGKATFSMDIVFKDDVFSCAITGGFGTGPILASGPGDVLAPSCDNSTFGG